LSKRNVDADDSQDVTPQRTILTIAPLNFLFALAKQQEEQNDDDDEDGDALWHCRVDTHLALVGVAIVTLDAETAQWAHGTNVTALNIRVVLVIGLGSTEAIGKVRAPFESDVVLGPRNTPVA
jgi:hypothetical protein